MVERRREYRKNFNSSGQLYISGELLNFISFDVSVAGIFVEIEQGLFLTEIGDFEALLKESNSAEIYVKDLMLTGDVEIVWAKQEKDKVRLGIEFRNVKYNADKLWRTRRYFRNKRQFSGYFIADNSRIDFQGINLSIDGLSVQMEQTNKSFEAGKVAKFFVDEMDIRGLAKIVWVNSIDENGCILGLRYLKID